MGPFTDVVNRVSTKLEALPTHTIERVARLSDGTPEELEAARRLVVTARTAGRLSSEEFLVLIRCIDGWDRARLVERVVFWQATWELTASECDPPELKSGRPILPTR